MSINYLDKVKILLNFSFLLIFIYMGVNLTIFSQISMAQSDFISYNEPKFGFTIDIPVTWNRFERNDGVLFSPPSKDNTINPSTSIFIHALMAPFANEQVNQIKNTLVNYYSSIKNNFIEQGFLNFPLPLTTDSYALVYSYNDEKVGKTTALDVLIFEDKRFSMITLVPMNLQDLQNNLNIYNQILFSYQPYIIPDIFAPPVDQTQNSCELSWNTDIEDYFRCHNPDLGPYAEYLDPKIPPIN